MMALFLILKNADKILLGPSKMKYIDLLMFKKWIQVQVKGKMF